MKTAATVARYLLGVGCVVLGANAFFEFLPAPENLPEQGGRFLGLLSESGYFVAVALLKIAGGLMLLLGRFVPLGLTLLGPILVNILLYHLAFDPAGIGGGLVFTLLWFVVFWRHKGKFRFLWTASAD